MCAPRLRRDPARPLKRPEDLRHHCLLHLDSGPGTHLLEWPPWLRAMKLEGLKPASVLHFSMYDQLIQAAVSGQGVALGRRPLVDDLIAQRKLVAALQRERGLAAQLLRVPVAGLAPQARGAARSWPG